MTATLVPIVVTGSWGEPDGTDNPTGTVTLDLTENITGPSFVTAKIVRAVTAFGALAQQLIANDFDYEGTPLTPQTTQYRVTEQLLGSPEQDYYVTIPATPPGARRITDGVLVQGTNLLVSASADFTDADLNSYLLFPYETGIPVGAQVLSVIDTHTVTMTAGSPITGSGFSVMIGAQVDLAQLRPS